MAWPVFIRPHWIKSSVPKPHINPTISAQKYLQISKVELPFQSSYKINHNWFLISLLLPNQNHKMIDLNDSTWYDCPKYWDQHHMLRAHLSDQFIHCFPEPCFCVLYWQNSFFKKKKKISVTNQLLISRAISQLLYSQVLGSFDSSLVWSTRVGVSIFFPLFQRLSSHASTFKV